MPAFPNTTPLDKALARLEEAVTRHREWEFLWGELARYYLPKHEFTNATARGQNPYAHLYDGTGVWANGQFAAFLHAFLTPPNVPWLNLGIEGEPNIRDMDALEWLHTTSEIVNGLLQQPSLRFGSVVHEMYLELGAFGSGTLFMDAPNALRFRSFPLNEVMYEQDFEGNIIGVYRWFPKTARQIASTFSGTGDTLPKAIREAAEKTPDQEFSVVHMVFPDDDTRLEGRYKSLWIHPDTKTLIRERMFKSFPYMGVRFERSPGDEYGLSIGMVALPDVRMLQAVDKTTLMAAQKNLDPPMQAPSAAFTKGLITIPGHVNYYTSMSRHGKAEPLNQGIRVDIGEHIIDRKRDNIIRAFYLDAVRDLTLREAKSPLKATEVVGRREEVFRLMGPIIVRLQNEFLGPTVKRLMNLLMRRGVLPPLPSGLQGAPLSVQFVSTASLAQRKGEVEQMTQWLNLVLPVLQVAPDALNRFDADGFFRRSAWLHNINPELLRSDEAVAQLNAQAQAEADAAQALAGAEGGAGAFRDVAQGLGALAPGEGLGASEQR